MNDLSFKKGEQFEEFVENNLFAQTDYELIHRTNSFQQNKKRFAENTMKPDFKFRCKKTLKEFYVEAKYRSKFNSENKIEIISFRQLERFRKIQDAENIPVFIVIGYQGYPNNPENLSLIPINELSYLELYSSVLNKYKINNSIVDSNALSKVERKIISEKKSEKNTPNIKKQKFIIGLILIAIISSVGFYISQGSVERKIKKRTTEYYQLIENGNIDALKNYIAPKVNRWYDKSNLTLDQIITETNNYLKKYPRSKTEIRWDTFEINELGDDYLCTYNLVYKITSNGKFKDKIYHLKINAIWGKDLKLKSISEERL